MTTKRAVTIKGRPRSFDPDEVLDCALRVFWKKGYEGTSLSDLTKAMGINRPSLYATFGDKETLFRKVLDRYSEGPAAYVAEAMREPSGRAAIESLLRGGVDLLTNSRNPKGCLLVQGALACGDESKSVKRDLIDRRDAGEAIVRERLKRAKAEGELAADVIPADLARFYVTVLRGMGVQALSGATRDELMRVVETALKAWPE
jgi:AcrR family transcriptional regulator